MSAVEGSVARGQAAEGAAARETAAGRAAAGWGRPSDRATRVLLGCGPAAGPLFLAVWLVQALTREGYDPSFHPLSLLSLGDLGWIQIANFVLCGLLYVACAAGLRRVLHPGRAGTWGPLLVAANGIGMIIAGVFTTDPGAGFPAGAPAGAPPVMSWHGVLHEIGFLVASCSGLALCFVFLRRFAALRRRGWVVACAGVPVLVIVVLAWPDLNSLSLRIVGASAIQFAFLGAVAVRVSRGLSETGR
ncbi:DUF998 domain-containing protein [Nonomuraea sp. NN258]|uniref:DUF998 domain-containing protein n=1 Tax=Nonomuraea antri TaxID=2730852 RepID=UPI00156981B5|nr:DUF998 domain-containing protein [Nonomuraea antri]NRQ39727.1 DUF998 domain-containing protein [Nonomuraea antri]